MKKPAITRRPTGRAPQEVRIMGGRWKRTPLPVAAVEGLRPTPARVRETLFNWLGQDLAGLRCVDAFAGTGALGLEAASRGAAEVLLVESDPRLVKTLLALKTRLTADTVRIERGDGVAALQQWRGQALDVVFLDPPFGDDGNPALFNAALLAARQALREDGLIYLEAPRTWSGDELAQLGLQLHRHGKAGMVSFHLLRLLPAQ
ncbi:MAG: 16S rRNA (guanine(966)-N(2))-methyltransferase RsmD [Hydrogenophaga sp.]